MTLSLPPEEASAPITTIDSAPNETTPKPSTSGMTLRMLMWLKKIEQWDRVTQKHLTHVVLLHSDAAHADFLKPNEYRTRMLRREADEATRELPDEFQLLVMGEANKGLFCRADQGRFADYFEELLPYDEEHPILFGDDASNTHKD